MEETYMALLENELCMWFETLNKACMPSKFLSFAFAIFFISILLFQILVLAAAFPCMLCSPAANKDDRRGRFQDTILVDGDLSAAHIGGFAALFNGFTTATTTTTTTTGSTCRYWCRTNTGAAYCCEEGTGTTTDVTVKPGSCPAVRPECPPTRHGSGPPVECSNDGSCSGTSLILLF